MIVLCMIVKNEGRGIVQTLESIRDHIDAWAIVDTGSTDGTQELVRHAMAGKMGTLFEEEFVDFATTRNRALELGEGIGNSVRALQSKPEHEEPQPVWLFMLSGDARVEFGHSLYAVARRAEVEGAIAANIKTKAWGLEYYVPLLTKAGAGCRYEGVTHEAMVVPGEPDSMASLEEDAVIVHYETSPDRRERWGLDLRLLLRDLEGLTPEQRRAKTRTLFYLAQTFECLGFPERAEELYQERIDAGCWLEERFIAQLRIGHCRIRTERPIHEIADALRAAAAVCPDRAEPLHDLCKQLRLAKRYHEAFVVGAKAIAIPKPSRPALFIESAVYDWRAMDEYGVAAYWAGHHEIAEKVSLALLANPRVPDEEKPRLERNLYFAQRALGGESPAAAAETHP